MNLLSAARRSRLLPVLGVLLVPLAVAGLLTWSLAQPQGRVQGVRAAVVNEDQPVTINGQMAPLGRQLTAKLAGNEIPGNYSWEITDRAKADEGLRDGTYAAVVTIPPNFSRAATSFSGDPAKSQKARVDVETSNHDQMADDEISQRVTNSAASLLGNQLTRTYLDNVYVGFNTLHDQLGQAAGGAGQLANGDHQLANGAGQLAQGAHALSGGLGQLDAGAEKLTTGTGALASGLGQVRDKTAQLPQQTSMLADVAGKEDQGTRQMSTELGNLARGLDHASSQCPPGVLPVCNELLEQKIRAQLLAQGSGQLTQASGGVSQGLNMMAGKAPGSGGGLPALAGGVAQLAGGADQLHSGMQQFQGGLGQAAGGQSKLASGADQLASGGQKLAGGTDQLHDGLNQAVQKLPTYPDASRGQLAGNVANPVVANSASNSGSGSSGVSLYAVLALWIGALATFVALRALPARALESTRSSFALAMRNFALPGGLAVAQGVLVTAVIGPAQDLSATEWVECGGLAVLAALSFTAVNQALVGALRGIGWFLSMLVAVVAVAAGLVEAVPSAIQSAGAAVPTGPAIDALRSVLSGQGQVGGAIALLVVWGVAALAVTVLAVERQRSLRSVTMLTKSPTAA